MKKIWLILLCLVMAVGNVEAYHMPKREDVSDEDVTFIVEVEGNPALTEKSMRDNFDLGDTTSEILADQEKVMSQIKKEVSKDSEKGFVYTALFNGFSIDGKREQLEQIKQLDGVKNVYISQKIPVPKPMLKSANEMTYINTAYDSGYSGKGQVIALIDDYCDTSHDFFAAEPESPKYTKADIDKILKENPLNSKAVSANQVYKSAKIPYAFDYASGRADTYSQTEYHGTHVTGIAAGKNGTYADGTNFSGVAYDAQILFMNASKDGYLKSEMILAAMNDAAYLNADVINMSFGVDYNDSDTAIIYKQNITNARKCGISVVTSAGNSSRGYDDRIPLTDNPDYSASGTPASFSDVTSVASANNSKMISSSWTVGMTDGTKLDFFESYQGSNFDELIKNDYVEYVYCGLGGKSDFEGKDLSGKIALIDRGVLNYTDKAANAKAAGAIGIIMANHEEMIATTVTLTLPTASITKSTGKILKNAVEKKIKFIEDKLTTMHNAAAGKISTYSSWGVDSSLQLKPEITAPGANIYSAYPDNNYVYLSGTSMSSPYVAGMFAAARQYYETNPYSADYNGLTNENLVDLIENIAMNSADIIRTDDGLPYSSRVQGAGMINAEKMLKSKVMLLGDSGKAKLSLGEIEDSFDVKFTVKNISENSIIFDDISIELLTDGYTENNGEYYVGDSVRITPDSILLENESATIEPGKDYTFTATINLNKEFLTENKKIFSNGFFIDGFVILNSSDGETSTSMPFTGFYGDWYNVPIFDSTVYDEGGSTLSEKDFPYTSGTYLKAYIDNYSYLLVGRNNVKESIVDKKYISYSSTGDLTLGLALTNYRAASKFRFSITDKAGKIYYLQTANALINKFYEVTYTFNKTAMSKLAEGDYIIHVDAVANGSNVVNDTLKLPLVIDNTPPEIISADYNEEEKTLTLSAKDNHYLNFICIDYDEKGYKYYEITDEDVKDGIATKTIDLSMVKKPETVMIEVEDYAFNYTYKSLDMLTDKIGIEVEDYQPLKGYTTLDFVLRNNTDSDINGDIIVAFYDKNSKLIASSVKKDYALKKGENDISYTMLSDTWNAAKLKVFVWDKNLQPADTVKRFDIKN